MKKLFIRIVCKYYQKVRIRIFRELSDNKRVEGTPKLNQPALYLGKGSILFNKNVNIGYFPSPFYFTGNCHFEARIENSRIIIGDNVYFNNNFVCIALEEIRIGNDVLIGTNVEIIDNDGHNIDPQERTSRNTIALKVKIEDNVWIGSNVKILKGVTIGKNSVIANGAIVTKDIPSNVIAAGIPANVIKPINND